MRKLAIIAAIVVGGIAAIAAALFLFVDVNQFRGTIQSQLQQRLHRQVTLGAMRLKLIPLSIRINDLVIGNAPGFPAQPPLVAAKELAVRVRLGPLLKKQLQVDSMRLSSPAVELVKSGNGVWNTAGLGGSGSSASGGEHPTAAVTLSDLEIDDGRLGITDLAGHQPKTGYEHIDVHIQDFAPGRPFHLTARVRAPQGDVAADATGTWNNSVLNLTALTASIGEVKASGHGEIRTADNPAVINAELRTGNAPIADLIRLANAGNELSGSGLLTLAVQIHGPITSPAYSGSGSLRDVKLNLASLRKPIEMQSAEIRLAQDRAALENITAKLGSTTVHGAVTVANFAQPQVDFRADADRINLAELEQLSAPAPTKTSRKAGSASLKATGTASVGALTYGQMMLMDVKANCKLDNGIIRLDPVSANAFGGSTQGAITVDTRADAGAYATQIALKSVDANKLLSATTSVKEILFGLLSGNADLQIKPKPGQDFARALNGSVQAQLANGRLAGVQLLNEAASLARAVGYTKRTEAFTNIQKLAGSVKIQDGVASTNDLQLVFEGGSMSAAGTAGLADQSLHLQVTTVLAKQVSDQVGGSKIGGWMSTALANSKGELIVPATVTGTFSQPRFMPDPERMAKLKLASFLPSANDPQGVANSVKSMMDAFVKKPPADGKKQEGSPANSLFNLLDGLRKKDPKR
ncbi:MAG TPA: AsmA family protein [Bryobacteraceae bacterium]